MDRSRAPATEGSARLDPVAASTPARAERVAPAPGVVGVEANPAGAAAASAGAAAAPPGRAVDTGGGPSGCPPGPPA
jgi:hypothetical protein